MAELTTHYGHKPEGYTLKLTPDEAQALRDVLGALCSSPVRTVFHELYKEIGRKVRYQPMHVKTSKDTSAVFSYDEEQAVKDMLP